MIDIGGRDSRLVDCLVARGLRCVTVLDVSATALARARARLGDRADRVRWIEADVAGPWTAPPVDIWPLRPAASGDDEIVSGLAAPRPPADVSCRGGESCILREDPE